MMVTSRSFCLLLALPHLALTLEAHHDKSRSQRERVELGHNGWVRLQRDSSAAFAKHPEIDLSSVVEPSVVEPSAVSTTIAGEIITEIRGAFDFVAKDAPDLMLSTAVLQVVKQEIARITGAASGDQLDEIKATFDAPTAPQAKGRLGLVTISYKFGAPANQSTAIVNKITTANLHDLAQDMRARLGEHGLDGAGLGVTRFTAAFDAPRQLATAAPTAATWRDHLRLGGNSVTFQFKIIAILLVSFAAVVACSVQGPKQAPKHLQDPRPLQEPLYSRQGRAGQGDGAPSAKAPSLF